VRLYVEVARRALQRQFAYRVENLAGLFTNSFFAYLRAAVFAAIYQSTATTLGGYGGQGAITYMWITQAMIMVVALWGWWDIELTIRSGDVVADLAKPFSYLGFWLARDVGRAAYFFALRGAPILLIGQLVSGLVWPATPQQWVLFLVSLLLAQLVSFAFRFLLNVSAFWTTDARGLGALVLAATMFLGGFVIPIRMFPDWAQPICLALPFASITQTPADLFVGRLEGAAVLGPLSLQVAWAIALLLAAQLATTAATRRVIVQGG
jgi:viologen exporter family transport system permease protein